MTDIPSYKRANKGALPWCDTALGHARRGELAPIEHVQRCPICLRRWRIDRALGSGYPAMSHDEAVGHVDTMVKQFADGRNHSDEPAHLGFYQHLAMCRECELEFALAVEAALLAARLTSLQDSGASSDVVTVAAASHTPPTDPPPGWGERLERLLSRARRKPIAEEEVLLPLSRAEGALAAAGGPSRRTLFGGRVELGWKEESNLDLAIQTKSSDLTLEGGSVRITAGDIDAELTLKRDGMDVTGTAWVSRQQRDNLLPTANYALAELYSPE